MAGQWQREFFLIMEDPFAVEIGVFELWVDGYSVREATEVRWSQFEAPPSFEEVPEAALRTDADTAEPDLAAKQSAFSDPTAASQDCASDLKAHFWDLLRQDCAQQYEAFEFLEEALKDPVHFLEFCPVQLTPSARLDFVCRYYSLDNNVVRELLRHPSVLRLNLQERKALAELAQIARLAGEKELKVQRITSNLQRALRWVEDEAKRRSKGNRVLLFGADDRDESAASSEVLELEALGESLSLRYRSLVFTLLLKFDLWSKGTQRFATEHVEDIASVLLACNCLPDLGEARTRFQALLYSDVSASPQAFVVAGATSVPSAPTDVTLNDSLRLLHMKMLRPKLNDFKALVYQELDKPQSVNVAVTSSTTTPTVTPRSSRGFFGRGSKKKGEEFKAIIEKIVNALVKGLEKLFSQAGFVSFFVSLADFLETLKTLDAIEQLDFFQRCFNAFELLAEKDQTTSRNQQWPSWIAAFRDFLEMYRACTACALCDVHLKAPTTPASGAVAVAVAGMLDDVEGASRQAPSWSPTPSALAEKMHQSPSTHSGALRDQGGLNDEVLWETMPPPKWPKATHHVLPNKVKL
eukprot:gnl/TRDRNA2_/TRDRNA2_150854_c0_seq1.p1 gnl/TRDRNA2_/TRDRNA2_150854_c0~~gnl/TRDRNA2_/TRDRNA2_150854_c0_seq1.p1  ORF type:complete len:581 (+),score=116.56 gnl/TRDRNA2_/TRDRNA2_150854_c0_seq1:45-1787(+)